MKKLTLDEIERFAACLNFSAGDAAAIADIFYREKLAGNWRLKRCALDTVADYIEEWENSWSRYSSWANLVQSEKDQGPDGYTEEVLRRFMNKGVFLLPSGTYILGCL